MTIIRHNAQTGTDLHSGLAIRTMGFDVGDEHRTQWQCDVNPSRYHVEFTFSGEFDDVQVEQDRAILEVDCSSRIYLDPSPVADNGALFLRFARREEARHRQAVVGPKELRYWRSGKGVTVNRRILCSKCKIYNDLRRTKKGRAALDLYPTTHTRYRSCKVCTRIAISPRKPLRWLYEAWLTWLGDKFLENAELAEYQKAFEDCLELGSIPPKWSEWRTEMNPAMFLGPDSPPSIYTQYEPLFRLTPRGPKMVVHKDGTPVYNVVESDWDQETTP